jgi:hypothetical protein
MPTASGAKSLARDKGKWLAGCIITWALSATVDRVLVVSTPREVQFKCATPFTPAELSWVQLPGYIVGTAFDPGNLFWRDEEFEFKMVGSGNSTTFSCPSGDLPKAKLPSSNGVAQSFKFFASPACLARFPFSSCDIDHVNHVEG